MPSRMRRFLAQVLDLTTGSMRCRSTRNLNNNSNQEGTKEGQMFEFYHGKLIAVTGSTGLNRSYMVKSLADTGARVRAIAHSRRLNEFSPMANEVKEADMT